VVFAYSAGSDEEIIEEFLKIVEVGS